METLDAINDYIIECEKTLLSGRKDAYSKFKKKFNAKYEEMNNFLNQTSSKKSNSINFEKIKKNLRN